MFRNNIAAPIAEGDVVARLEVSGPGIDTRSYDLEAAEDIAKQGMVGRALAGLGSLFGGN